jgi:hypothetical protein
MGNSASVPETVHQGLEMYDKRGKTPVVLTFTGDALQLSSQAGTPKPINLRMHLHQVGSMSLNYAPPTEYGPAHWVCQLRDRAGQELAFRVHADHPPHIWRNYTEAIHRIHQGLQAHPHQVQYRRGMQSRFWFWVVMGITGSAFALLEVAGFMGMLRKQNYVVGAICLLGLPFVAYYLLRFMALMAQPGVYDPQNIPVGLLPGG